MGLETIGIKGRHRRSAINRRGAGSRIVLDEGVVVIEGDSVGLLSLVLGGREAGGPVRRSRGVGIVGGLVLLTAGIVGGPGRIERSDVLKTVLQSPT